MHILGLLETVMTGHLVPIHWVGEISNYLTGVWGDKPAVHRIILVVLRHRNISTHNHLGNFTMEVLTLHHHLLVAWHHLWMTPKFSWVMPNLIIFLFFCWGVLVYWCGGCACSSVPEVCHNSAIIVAVYTKVLACLWPMWTRHSLRCHGSLPRTCKMAILYMVSDTWFVKQELWFLVLL